MHHHAKKPIQDRENRISNARCNAQFVRARLCLSRCAADTRTRRIQHLLPNRMCLCVCVCAHVQKIYRRDYFMLIQCVQTAANTIYNIVSFALVVIFIVNGT